LVSAAAEGLFNLNAQCGTMFSLPDKKDVYLMGQHCTIHPLRLKASFCHWSRWKMIQVSETFSLKNLKKMGNVQNNSNVYCKTPLP
jgi:hypothetical protein